MVEQIFKFSETTKKEFWERFKIEVKIFAAITFAADAVVVLLFTQVSILFITYLILTTAPVVVIPAFIRAAGDIIIARILKEG